MPPLVPEFRDDREEDVERTRYGDEDCDAAALRDVW